MVSSVSTSVSNVYEIMNSPGEAIGNTDPYKTFSAGANMQKNVQEVQAETEKGGNDNFRQSLHKLDIKV